jgi:hypothetical protein
MRLGLAGILVCSGLGIWSWLAVLGRSSGLAWPSGLGSTTWLVSFQGWAVLYGSGWPEIWAGLLCKARLAWSGLLGVWAGLSWAWLLG